MTGATLMGASSLKALYTPAGNKIAYFRDTTLAILRCYGNDELTMKQVRGILRQMENFHVQFTAVTAQRTGGGTARMYAASAEELANARSDELRIKALNGFRQKMKERVPSEAEFRASFAQIEFFSGNTKDKALVQYLLQRLDAHQRQGVPIDYSKMTVEHIAPENPSLPGSVSATHIGKLGNLLLLENDHNSRLGNKSFPEKLKSYRKNGVPLDPILAKATVWTDNEVDQRTEWLATFGYTKVFTL